MVSTNMSPRATAWIARTRISASLVFMTNPRAPQADAESSCAASMLPVWMTTPTVESPS